MNGSSSVVDGNEEASKYACHNIFHACRAIDCDKCHPDGNSGGVVDEERHLRLDAAIA